MFSRWLPSLNAVTIRNDDLKEPAGYLGLLPVLASLFLWRFPRRDLARYLTAMLALICVASLGPVLHVSGFAGAPWLWIWAIPVPLLNNALPARFMMYAFLVAGLIVALLARRSATRSGPGPSRSRWLLGVAVAVSLMPAIPFSQFIGKADLPEFFRDGMYAHYLSRDETVLILPYGDTSHCMLWQAATNFYFKMPQGVLGITPQEFQAWPIVDALNKDAPYIPGYEDQFKAFLAAHDVGAIIVSEASEGDSAAFDRLVSTVIAQRDHVGGVFLYRIDRESLAPYRNLGADEMESRYNFLRFQMLFGAAKVVIFNLEQKACSTISARRRLWRWGCRGKSCKVNRDRSCTATGQSARCAEDHRSTADRLVDHAHRPALQVTGLHRN